MEKQFESEQKFDPPFDGLVDYFNGGDQLERFLELFTSGEVTRMSAAQDSRMSSIGA